MVWLPCGTRTSTFQPVCTFTMPPSSGSEQPLALAWKQASLHKMYGALVAFFLGAGVWLATDLQRAYDNVLRDTAHLANQRSQIIGQAFRTKVLASDYVLRDVLGHIAVKDLAYPDPDPVHAQRMTTLLREKADTVPDFFSMVLFNQGCVFTATHTGQNTGVRSRQALCDARKAHTGSGPLASYVPRSASASGQPVLVLSRHLRSPDSEFQGGVLGVIELDKAQRLFNSPGLGPDDTVALLDDAQVLLARQPVLAEAIETQVKGFQVPRATDVPQSTGLTQRDMDGRERIFGFSNVEGFPFTVAYAFDKQKVLEDWRRRAVELVVGYAVLLLLAVWVARSHWTTLEQREALRSSEEQFRMLAENMADIVWRADAQLRFTYINAADQRVRGFDREEVIGTYLQDYLTPQGRDMLEDKLRELRMGDEPPARAEVLKYELPARHKQGDEVWVEMSSVTLYGVDGHIKGYQGLGRDITGRRQQDALVQQSQQALENQLLQAADEKSALQELATRDPLTGLHNRRFLDAALPRELARSERDGLPLAIIMMDLDHFKLVNDHYGHPAGDQVLKVLAQLLKTGARESDLICRYGGEEFVAIMPNMSSAQAIVRVDSWRHQLQDAHVQAGDAQIRVTLSAGIAMFPDHGNDPALLLARADEMLYRSKQEGRNRVTLYGMA